MKRLLMLLLLAGVVLPAAAQADRHDVRAGNRKFRKDKYKAAEVDYRKAALRDSTSVAAQYNLASSLYRQDNFDEAGKALESVKEVVPASGHEAEWQFNRGDVALQKKDYASAVDAFRQALILNPEDMDAKENYTYAKLMLQNQQNGGNDQNQDKDKDRQNQNQNQNQDQDQNQEQNQDQNQNQDDNQNQDRDQSEQKISPQQAQQMLKAIQAKEKETQDKVKKEKAALLKSRQKDKNW